MKPFLPLYLGCKLAALGVFVVLANYNIIGTIAVFGDVG